MLKVQGGLIIPSKDKDARSDIHTICTEEIKFFCLFVFRKEENRLTSMLYKGVRDYLYLNLNGNK